MELDITLPLSVARALSVLEACGYEAYTVGGCVRDSLLGRTPNDWDITTNATPAEMKACFKGFRVIETGIQHGTLTVIVDGMQLEITTYRNDGEYLDNRHPKEVTFFKNIEDDTMENIIVKYASLESKQVFIAFDHIASFSEEAIKILREHTILSITPGGRELFGRSWNIKN